MGLYRLIACKKAAGFAICLFGGFLSCSTSHAVEIYRWVDESGRTHFSDTPPHQSKRPVARIDSQQHETSPEQRKAAEARAADEKARSTDIAEPKNSEAPTSSLPAPQTDSTTAEPSPKANDCASLLQQFREHSECLAPFMNANGSFKPNAFETCGPAVPYPAKECS